MTLHVRVPGVPVTQGSMRTVRGRTFHEHSDALDTWRDTVAWYTRSAMTERGGIWPWRVPVRLHAAFWLERPKTVTRPWPSVPPDLDKLVRAVGDSLKIAGAVADDGQIVIIEARKEYGTVPGLDMLVTALEER